MRGVVDGEYVDGELWGVTFIAGQRGMGKTTEAIRLVEQCGGSVVFFDTVGKHVSLLSGFVEFNQPGPLKEYLLANRGRRARVVYVPRDEFPELHLIAVCLIVRIFGSMIFCVDEIDTFCGARWGDQRMPIELYNLVQVGRHWKVSMLCTARDPASLSLRFRSQCAFMRIFRTDEDAYVKYFAGRIGKVNAARLASLPRTYYLFWQSGDSAAEIRGGPRKL